MTSDPHPLNTPETRARGLFVYDVGAGPVYADALRLQFALQGACPGGDLDAFDALLATLDDPAATDLRALEASLGVADVAGAMFGLAPLDAATGAGLTAQERVALLGQFLLATAPGPAGDDAPGDGATDDEHADADADAAP